MWSRDRGDRIQEDLEQSGVSTVRVNPNRPRATEAREPARRTPVLGERLIQGLFEHWTKLAGDSRQAVQLELLRQQFGRGFWGGREDEPIAEVDLVAGTIPEGLPEPDAKKSRL